VVDPAAHDRALARTSHLPYLLSRAIAEAGRASAARGLAGPGFASMTRLAKSDPRTARAYVAANVEEVNQAWVALRSRTERALRTLRIRRGPPKR
jgi:prephenate dehydrogenase